MWQSSDLLCCSLPVPLSLADTFTIPLASMSKVTSTCGTPRGAGGIPTYSMKKITTEVMVAIVQTISITKDRDTLEKLVMVPVSWKHFLSMDVSHFFHLFYVTAVVLKFCVGNRHAVGQNWSTCVSLKFNHYVVTHLVPSCLSYHYILNWRLIFKIILFWPRANNSVPWDGCQVLPPYQLELPQ